MNQETNRNSSFFRFEDLRVYNKAIDFACDVAATCANNVMSTASNILNSLSDSAKLIAVHIAECPSNDKQGFSDSLKAAKAEIRRCVVYITLAAKAGGLSDTEEQEYRTQLMELTKMIGALINSLYKSNNNGQQPAQQEDDLESLTW